MLIHLIFLLFIGQSYASEFDILIRDANLFEADIEFMMEKESMDSAEIDLQNASGLFPSTSSVEEGIGIEVSGIAVVLRDIPSTAWYAPYVQTAAKEGILSGYRNEQGILTGKYGPSDTVTIEQLAKIAVRVGSHIVGKCDGTVRNNSVIGRWSERYVACAEWLDWTVFESPDIDVKRPATRMEVVVTLLEAMEVEMQTPSGDLFDDVSRSTTHAGFIERAAGDGVITGFFDKYGQPTGTFGPEENINRAEMAKVIVKTMEVYEDYAW